jgi:hypothetical protein
MGISAGIEQLQQQLMVVAHAQLDANMVVRHIDGSWLARLPAFGCTAGMSTGFPSWKLIDHCALSLMFARSSCKATWLEMTPASSSS